MEIVDHTNEHQPTLMRDVLTELIGKEVVLNMKSGRSFSGTLWQFNGHLVRLTNKHGHNNTYILMYEIEGVFSQD
jgi:prophage tail gpP-like protein